MIKQVSDKYLSGVRVYFRRRPDTVKLLQLMAHFIALQTDLLKLIDLPPRPVFCPFRP